MQRNVQFRTSLLMIHMLAICCQSIPLRLYLDGAEDTLTNQITKPLNPDQEELVLIEDSEPVLIYVPDSEELPLLSSLLVPRSGKKPSRLRRNLSGSTNPGTSPIDYQKVWPVLNAAKDRAIELADEGHRRKEQSVTKRQEWALPAPEATEHLTRYSRNLPEQEKMFQIHTVGDLPMFRFG